MDQIADALAYEIKREVATRYFGFRKNIETISALYRERLAQYSRGMKEKLSRDIRRLQYLFPVREHFQSAVELAGLTMSFADKALTASEMESKKEIFSGLSTSGFTRRGRFLHLGRQSFAMLLDHLDEYHEVYCELMAEQQEIANRIRDFEIKNDLSGILGFFRGLESNKWQADILQTDTVIGADQALVHDLRIPLPPPVTTEMPDLAEPPLFTRVSRALDRLLKLSYHYQNNTTSGFH
jgi:hypothetical protein